MTSATGSRIKAFAPSLLLACFAFLTACASTDANGPPVSISTGQPRAPVQAGTEIATDGTPVDGDQALADLLASLGNAQDGYLPRFMQGRDVTRVALLLPFSHPNANVRREAEGLLAGAEMALFEKGDDTILLIPRDTRGSRSGAEEATNAAIADGADIILGPLFSENVRVVSEIARAQQIPVIAFSNDRTAAGNGAYILAIGPEAEVSHVVEYAAARGIDSFAFFGPDSSYGRRAEQALRIEAGRRGGRVIAAEFYDPSNEAPVDQAKALASVLRPEVASRPGRVAVLIPERGLKLLAVAPLLPYYDVNIRQLTLMGTGQWNDPQIWREPTLAGAIFAAPDPESLKRFNDGYSRIYRSAPSDLASLGYDGAATAIGLAVTGGLDRVAVENRDGFRGVNGLFRFRIDGTTDRRLSVMQITSEGVIVVGPAAERFTSPES